MDARTEHRVLIAHPNDDYVSRVLAKCRERGIQVVGPAGTARMALALAALAPVSFALVARSLPDERNGDALAEALNGRWGVAASVIDCPDPEQLIRDLPL